MVSCELHTVNIFSYFRYPFPSSQGFSAYRMPGMAIHGPLIMAFTFTGFALCWPHPALRWLLIVWAVAGLYFGRDIAIYCHYAPILTLIVWAVCAVVLVKAQSIARFGASHVVVPGLLSGLVTATLVLVAWKETKTGEE
jgi:hypothetical protein